MSTLSGETQGAEDWLRAESDEKAPEELGGSREQDEGDEGGLGVHDCQGEQGHEEEETPHVKSDLALIHPRVRV